MAAPAAMHPSMQGLCPTLWTGCISSRCSSGLRHHWCRRPLQPQLGCRLPHGACCGQRNACSQPAVATEARHDSRSGSSSGSEWCTPALCKRLHAAAAVGLCYSLLSALPGRSRRQQRGRRKRSGLTRFRLPAPPPELHPQHVHPPPAQPGPGRLGRRRCWSRRQPGCCRRWHHPQQQRRRAGASRPYAAIAAICCRAAGSLTYGRRGAAAAARLCGAATLPCICYAAAGCSPPAPAVGRQAGAWPVTRCSPGLAPTGTICMPKLPVDGNNTLAGRCTVEVEYQPHSVCVWSRASTPVVLGTDVQPGRRRHVIRVQVVTISGPICCRRAGHRSCGTPWRHSPPARHPA
jgi:hypothetical protein